MVHNSETECIIVKNDRINGDFRAVSQWLWGEF